MTDRGKRKGTNIFLYEDELEALIEALKWNYQGYDDQGILVGRTYDRLETCLQSLKRAKDVPSTELVKDSSPPLGVAGMESLLSSKLGEPTKS